MLKEDLEYEISVEFLIAWKLQMFLGIFGNFLATNDRWISENLSIQCDEIFRGLFINSNDISGGTVWGQ